MNDITAQRIVNAVEKGLPRHTAAKLARVHPATFFNWLARGRNGDVGYVEFYDRVREAESKGEQEIVYLLRSHAQKNWQACAFLLERRNPKEWAARKVEASEVPQTVGTVESRDEQIAHVESVLEALRSAG